MLGPDPPIDEPAVVADLIAAMFNGLDDVQILVAGYLAQYISPTSNSAGSAGVTMHSCPDSMRAVMD
jgi:hypothetical protein